MWSKSSVSFPAWEVEMQMRVTGPGRRGAQGMVSGPYSCLLGKQVTGSRYQCPTGTLTYGSGNFQDMWYTQDRGQVGSVLERPASWNGIRISFDTSASDIQVGSHLMPTLRPVLLLIFTFLIVL